MCASARKALFPLLGVREAPGPGLLSCWHLLPLHGCLVCKDPWGRVLLLQEPGEVPGSSSFTERCSEAAWRLPGVGDGRCWGECPFTSFSTDPHVPASRAWASPFLAARPCPPSVPLTQPLLSSPGQVEVSGPSFFKMPQVQLRDLILVCQRR